MLHCEAADESACPAKPRLAMDCDGPALRMEEMSVADLQEVSHNVLRWV